jgi:cell division protein FtsQ
MKRLANILTWVGLGAWFVLIMGFVSGKSEEVLCTRIEVSMDDTLSNRFVTPSQIRAMLVGSEIALQGYPLSGINTRILEQMIEENPYVLNAEVSTDISGQLKIRVYQREPLVRIMPEGRGGYYLDTEGVVLPLAEHFTPHILLATGHIGEMKEASGKSRMAEIYRFSRYIADHDLWKDQVVQIYVNSRGEYEIIPRVGAHQILLGTMDQWEQKLSNLELLYRQGLSRQGWNTYSTINLKYTNQVICTKR